MSVSVCTHSTAAADCELVLTAARLRVHTSASHLETKKEDDSRAFKSHLGGNEREKAALIFATDSG